MKNKGGRRSLPPLFLVETAGTVRSVLPFFDFLFRNPKSLENKGFLLLSALLLFFEKTKIFENSYTIRTRVMGGPRGSPRGLFLSNANF